MPNKPSPKDKERRKCHKYIEYYDTAGKPVYSYKCYCGTTGCMENVQLDTLSSIEIIKEKRLDELTKEEEDLFYKKVLKTKLI
jgi:hypothetical protein